MKRIAAILSIFLILATSIGATVAFHYCGEILQDVAVFREAMPCCGAMETSGCCHEQKVEIKSDASKLVQSISNVGFIPVLICQVVYPILDFTSQFQNSSQYFTSHLDNDRPPDDGEEIIILVQSFLI